MKGKKFFLCIVVILIAIIILVFASFFMLKKGNDDAAIILYKDLISTIANKNPNERCQYISIDLSKIVDPLSKESLSNEAKENILTYCKKYNNTIYDKSKSELLSSSNYGDKNGLYGLSITLNIDSISYKKANISISYYIANQSSGMATYIVKYINNKWEITDTLNNIIS